MISKSKRFRKRKSYKDIFFSTILILFVLIVIGFLIFSSIRINKRKKELTSRIETLKKEIQILEQKNQELKTKVSQAETEYYLEKIAKETLGLKKPGEEVAAITQKKEEEKEIIKEKSFWQKFLEIFKF
jgi:cell division protein FtsL